MRKQILALLLFSCISIIVSAQNIKGVVLNELNQPLETAYIYNNNTNSHTHTSDAGVFVIGY
ncbi:hypothetical protein [Winogradskyella sp.]|uniref:hypothetical protein n=1 Tax=Winogradskyella sp. TaxID=1883156 RepID=UPI003F6CDBED